jgi:hypothetical protein
MDSSGPAEFPGESADHRKSHDGPMGKTRRHGRDRSNLENRR